MKKISKVINIIFFILIIYFVIRSDGIKNNNKLKENISLQSAFSGFGVENFKTIFQEDVNKQNDSEHAEEKSSNENSFDVESVNNVETGGQESSSQNDIVEVELKDVDIVDENNNTSENEISDSKNVNNCLVKKSQCNTCSRKDVDSMFMCTQVFCENESYTCEEFAE